MKQKQKLRAIDVAVAFDGLLVECMYPGVRADVAISMGIAPNNKEFHAVWERLEFSPADHGRDFMIAYPSYWE